MDKFIIEHLFDKVMSELGMSRDENNFDTPRRIADMLVDELFVNYNRDEAELVGEMTYFPATSNRPVLIKNIPFYSTCEHHWLPFFGKATIEYVPDEILLGLSKFPRVVKWFSKKPQIQERLTEDIGRFLVEFLEPRYLKVVLHDAVHTCVTARGAESECTTDTVFEYVKE